MQLSMFSSAEPPVSHSASQDCEQDWAIRVATSCLPLVPLLQSIAPAGAAAVLFERQSLRGDLAPSRGARQAVAGGLAASAGKRGGVSEPDRGGLICMAQGQGGAEIRQDGGAPTLTCNHEAPIVAASLLAGGHANNPLDETLVPVAFDSRQDCVSSKHVFGALGSSLPQAQAVALPWRARRVTPRECERLQGFPDDYTAIPGAKDGPRYKALGNSMAVPVMAWIGRRIAMVSSIMEPT